MRTSLSGKKQVGSDQRRYPERWCAESHGASHHKQHVDAVQSGVQNPGVRIKFILLGTNKRQLITRKFLFSDFLG